MSGLGGRFALTPALSQRERGTPATFAICNKRINSTIKEEEIAMKKMSSPKQPKIKRFEITLEIETGNLIHRKFDNWEDLAAFAKEYANNPQKILDEITPKRNKKIGEQSSFYDVEDDEEEF